jgi:hypothetical protein
MEPFAGRSTRQETVVSVPCTGSIERGARARDQSRSAAEAEPGKGLFVGGVKPRWRCELGLMMVRVRGAATLVGGADVGAGYRSVST